MKRILTLSLTGVLTCVLLISGIVSVFAAEGKATINGVEAPVGSTVEYSLDLVAEKQMVVGIQMVFKYDTKVLELKDVVLEKFPSATINANNNKDGMIYFNCSDINGVDFTKAAEVANITFEVIGEGDTNIEYLIQYLYDIDLVNIYDYKLSYSLSVDDVSKIENKPPVLADVNDIISNVGDSFDKGDFVNNEEGTGSGEKPAATAAPAGNNVSQNTENDKNNENNALFVVAGVVVVALVAVIIFAVIKRNKTEEEQ